MRIGIGKPENAMSVSDFVLDNFNNDEKEKLEVITSNIVEYFPILLDKKLDLFSSTINNK